MNGLRRCCGRDPFREMFVLTSSNTYLTTQFLNLERLKTGWRQVISWVTTTTGISGEMIRDMMVQCVEQRFGDIGASAKCNGSIFPPIAAVRLPQPRTSKAPRAESNDDMAEASRRPSGLTTFVSIGGDASTALMPVDYWMRIRTRDTLIPGGVQLTREYIASSNQPSVRSTGSTPLDLAAR
jgi:putative transposase